jgi:RNA polymerase sigma-70 factor (ECF subfamily)
MALPVVMQCLTPSKRAVLLLWDVFDFEYDREAHGQDRIGVPQIAGTCAGQCGVGRETVCDVPKTYQRLLAAFTQAAFERNVDALVGILAEDAVMITDGTRWMARRWSTQSAGSVGGRRRSPL